LIRGTVSPDGVPLITLTVAGRQWSAIIGTGFNGDLELPLQLKDQLRAQFIGRIESALAGGQSIEEDAYSVKFPFNGQTLLAEVTFVAGNEILIGTRLLRAHRLEINFPQRSVLIE